MRFLILFSLLIGAALTFPVGVKRLTGGFRVQKMELDFLFRTAQPKRMDPEIRASLGQPFHYLDRGSQCYVFESEDKKFVVKFFRFDSKPHLLRSFFFLPVPAAENSKWKIALLFKACQLAYERVPEETGLLYIHLNRTEEELPVLHCKDAIGRSYRLPLDRYRFVIQKKAELLTQVLEKRLCSKNEKEIEWCLDALFDLIQARTAKALHNTDPNLGRNFGFLQDRAIEIDFGCYRDGSNLDLAHQQIKEMRRFCKQLRSWLKDRAPEWIPYLEGRMKQFEEEQ